jgi:hypothetical protein
MGALSTVFTGAGQPALLFLVGAVSRCAIEGPRVCAMLTKPLRRILQAVIAVMPAFLIPLRRV